MAALLNRILFRNGGTGRTTTYAPCTTCGTYIPVDPDGWDAQCDPCATAYAERIHRIAQEATRAYCTDCGGRHIKWVFHPER